MKLKGFILTLAMMANTSYASYQKVIYGDDNRRDVHEVSNAMFLELASATAAIIKERDMETVDGVTTISGKTLGDRIGLCESEPFRDQLSVAGCSGFLVAPNILVTAGHCARTETQCQSVKYVFGYNKSAADQTEYTVPEKNVYSCKKLIKSVLNSKTPWMDGDQMDYAVIELDRDVEDVRPVKFRETGKIADGEEIVVIGHPSGLPTKITDGGFVRKNDDDVFFVANTDTYGGNSGSAVFNVTTGEVEGILVRGERDYVREDSCSVSKSCEMGECRGEDITRITNVKEIMEDTGPVVDPVTDPVVDPVTDPVVDPVTDPVVDPVTDPVVEPVTDPVVDPVTDPVVEPVTDPVVDPLTDPVDDEEEEEEPTGDDD